MKVITLGLALAFFVLALMVIAGSFNFFNSSKTQIDSGLKPDCVEASYQIENMLYDGKLLSFDLKQSNDFSNKPVLGVQIRGQENATATELFTKKPLINGMSESLSLNITLDSDGLFFVSPAGCPADYEKRCYLDKERCQ